MRTPLYRNRPVAPYPAEFGQARRINEFIVLSEGNSNVYLIETPDGGILVNSGMGFEAPVHHQNLLAHSDTPIRYIVLTQGHVDHVGGVQYFRDQYPDLVCIAQAGNPEHQAYDARLAPFRASRSAFRFQEAFMSLFERYAEAGYTQLNPQDRPTPDVLFDDNYQLTLGGLTIELISAPGAETNDSLVLWLPEQRIVLTGNLFGCPFGHFPNLVTIRGDRYRDALTCAAAAQTVLDLKPDLLLYGHHDPVEGSDVIGRELIAYRDAIHYVHDAVVDGMNSGKPLETLQREIALPEHCEVGQGYGKLNWSIRAIWEHYAGWFKHESTTELYSVPRSSVDSDLLELAGANALVARAAKLFEESESERALHLLEIVMNVEPDSPGARELAIEIHQSLLDQAKTFCHTGNFWLEGWLENQIKLLKGGTTESLRV